jgi:hypothetical protein
LQHPEFATLDRELAVLHVFVVFFEQLGNGGKLIVDFRQFFFQLVDRVGGANTGDDVFALRVQKILAIEFLFAVRWIARESHTGAAAGAHVSKHHRLHVHCRAERIGNAIDAAIVDCTTAHPGVEHRCDRNAQLFVGIFGNGRPLSQNDLLFRGDDVAQVI